MMRERQPWGSVSPVPIAGVDDLISTRPAWTGPSLSKDNSDGPRGHAVEPSRNVDLVRRASAVAERARTT